MWTPIQELFKVLQVLINKNSTGIKIQGAIYSGTILTHKKPTHISNGKRTSCNSFRASPVSSEVCFRNVFKLHGFIYEGTHTWPINNVDETRSHLLLQITLHPSPLYFCTVWLTNNFCSVASGWLWLMGALAEIRVRDGNENGIFIPWLLPQGRKLVSLHRKGCTLLKVAFLTRLSPPRFL